MKRLLKHLFLLGTAAVMLCPSLSWAKCGGRRGCEGRRFHLREREHRLHIFHRRG